MLVLGGHATDAQRGGSWEGSGVEGMSIRQEGLHLESDCTARLEVTENLRDNESVGI